MRKNIEDVAVQPVDGMNKFEGRLQWYLNEKVHREDGPAIIHDDGTKEWYLNGKRHRVDGPAIIRDNGTEKWFINGKRHRVDGPAIIRDNGNEEWYLNGKEYTAWSDDIDVRDVYPERFI